MGKKILNVVLFAGLFFLGFLWLPHIPGWAGILAAVLVFPSNKFQAMLDRLFKSHKTKLIVVTIAVIVLACINLYFCNAVGAEINEGKTIDWDSMNLWVMDIARVIGYVLGGLL